MLRMGLGGHLNPPPAAVGALCNAGAWKKNHKARFCAGLGTKPTCDGEAQSGVGWTGGIWGGGGDLWVSHLPAALENEVQMLL